MTRILNPDYLSGFQMIKFSDVHAILKLTTQKPNNMGQLLNGPDSRHHLITHIIVQFFTGSVNLTSSMKILLIECYAPLGHYSNSLFSPGEPKFHSF
jgi:hypothetical protein